MIYLYDISMILEERLEFNQGDIGLPGGVQVLEPANVSSVTVDAIKRYGGSTAPTMPWPEEQTDDVMISHSIVQYSISYDMIYIYITHYSIV